MSEILDQFRNILVALVNIIKIIFHDWHIRKFLNFSNLLKLLFIYTISVLWVIVLDFDFSKGFWGKAIKGELTEKRASIYSVKNRIGEGLLYERMIEYMEENNYDYTGVRYPESLTHFSVTEHFYYVAASLLNYIFKPNFNLALTHHVNIVPYGFNIVYLNMPRDFLYSAHGEFLKPWQHLNKFDGFADLYILSNGKNDQLKAIAGNRPIMPIYLAQKKTVYKSIDFDKALITGSLWGCNRGALRIKLALKKLAEDGLLEAIGLAELDFLGKHYLGKLENFGKVIESLIVQQQKYGISLIVHNQEHALDGIPTSRISESAGSSAIIISDHNKFLEKYFADSVLFFDAFADEDEIHKQVKNHILWIKANPDKARAMAKKAFDIFNDNFTIEAQMENLFNFKR